MSTEKKNTNSVRIRTLVTAAMLTAVGVVVSFIIDVPILPTAHFLKYTPSDIPTLLGSFAFGPIIGGAIALARALLHGLLTGFKNGPIGYVMDSVAALSLAVSVGVVYRARRTRNGALIGLLIGSAAMIIISVAVNYFWSYPAYGVPASAVWTTALPFNVIKCVINGVVIFFIYKPLSPVLHGRDHE